MCWVGLNLSIKSGLVDLAGNTEADSEGIRNKNPLHLIRLLFNNNTHFDSVHILIMIFIVESI
jgi:hypothetical protein